MKAEFVTESRDEIRYTPPPKRCAQADPWLHCRAVEAWSGSWFCLGGDSFAYQSIRRKTTLHHDRPPAHAARSEDRRKSGHWKETSWSRHGQHGLRPLCAEVTRFFVLSHPRPATKSPLRPSCGAISFVPRHCEPERSNPVGDMKARLLRILAMMTNFNSHITRIFSWNKSALRYTISIYGIAFFNGRWYRRNSYQKA